MADDENPETGDAPAENETEGDKGGQTEGAEGDGEEGEDTKFRNLYKTYYLPPWEDEEKPVEEEEETEKKPRPRRFKDHTIVLTDENAEHFGDITRVGWKGRVDYAVEAMKRTKVQERAFKNEYYRNPNNLLRATISTIMMLASNVEDIPEECFWYTELYLKNVRDDTGHSPPNISNLLKYIRYVRKQKDITIEDEYRVLPPDDLTITRFPRQPKVPVSINLNITGKSAAGGDGAGGENENADEDGDANAEGDEDKPED